MTPGGKDKRHRLLIVEDDPSTQRIYLATLGGIHKDRFLCWIVDAVIT